MRLIIIVLTIGILSYSCSEKKTASPLVVNTAKGDTVQFKNWLTDTVKYIKNQNDRNIKMIIPLDSTYFELHEKYDLTIIPNQDIKDRNVQIAMSTLESNDILPKEKFNLSFKLNYFFDIGFNNKVYVYEYEFEDFIVKTSLRKIKYSFIKGNLIDKKILD